jgi:hypothetical protein
MTRLLHAAFGVPSGAAAVLMPIAVAVLIPIAVVMPAVVGAADYSIRPQIEFPAPELDGLCAAAGADGAVCCAIPCDTAAEPWAPGLRVAVGYGDGWRYVVADADQDAGAYPSTAVEPSGRIWVSYSKRADGSRRVARGNMGIWSIEVVDFGGPVHPYSAMSVAPNGTPYTLAVRTDGRIALASRAGGMWSYELLPDVGMMWPRALLAFDSGSTPHVAALNTATRDLVHLWRTQAGWQSEIVDTLPGLNVDFDLAAGPGDTVAMAYTGQPGTQLVLCYACKGPTGWQVEQVAADTLRLYTSLAFDGSGEPAIASVIKDYRGYLQLARRSGGVWTESEAWRVYDPDEILFARLMFPEPDPLIVTTTHYGMNAIGESGGTWTARHIEQPVSFAYYTDAFLDADGRFVAAGAGPYTGADDPIGVVVSDAGGMLRFPAPLPASYVSFARTPDGDLAAAAWSDLTNQLLYAELQDGVWTVETAAPLAYCAGTSLAFDPNGEPVIAYRDGSEIKLAARVANVWSIEGTHLSGQAPSLAFDGAGRPAILHSRSTEQVALSIRDNGAWTTEEVITLGAPDTVLDERLLFAPTGEPIALLHVWFSGPADWGWTSKVVTKTGGDWVQTIVEPLHRLESAYPDIAIGLDGEAYVACGYVYGHADNEIRLWRYLGGGLWTYAAVLDDYGDEGSLGLAVDGDGVAWLAGGGEIPVLMRPLPGGVTSPEVLPIDPAWNLISFPYPVPGGDPEGIAGMGQLNGRLSRWDPVAKNPEIYPDDFTEVEVGRGYMLWTDRLLTPTYEGYKTWDRFEIALPEAGITLIGCPGNDPVPLASIGARNDATGEVRSATEDSHHADPWVNWNLVYWNSALETAQICSMRGGDDDALRPWVGYRVWSYRPQVTLIVP